MLEDHNSKIARSNMLEDHNSEIAMINMLENHNREIARINLLNDQDSQWVGRYPKEANIHATNETIHATDDRSKAQHFSRKTGGGGGEHHGEGEQELEPGVQSEIPTTSRGCAVV